MNIVFLFAQWDSIDGKREDITARRAHPWLQHGTAEPSVSAAAQMISGAGQNSCLSERQAHITQLHSQKEENTTLENLRIAMFDSRAPEVFRCFLPHGNLCKIHFVDKACCVLCGRLCRYRQVCTGAYHLISEKARAAINAFLHCTAYWHMLVTIFHVTLHKEDKVSHEQFK